MKKTFIKIKGKDFFEIGLKIGKLFKKEAILEVRERRREKDWKTYLKNAFKTFELTKEFFPEYIEELRGISKSTGLSIKEIWALSVEEKGSFSRCTTLALNNGKLIGHSEDWQKNSENTVLILERNIIGFTKFEIFYINSLGGNSISWNSHGFIHSVNTLFHKNKNEGIPRNIIARFLSDTNDPWNDLEKLKEIPMSLGYHHMIVSKEGRILSIESCGDDIDIKEMKSPFIHTNHYLGRLREKEEEKNDFEGTHTRYKRAKELGEKVKDINGMKMLLEDKTYGDDKSIYNQRTIARMIIDLDNNKAFYALKRDGFLWKEYVPCWIK